MRKGGRNDLPAAPILEERERRWGAEISFIGKVDFVRSVYDRGRGNLIPPPSEPDRQFSRIRLSS